MFFHGHTFDELDECLILGCLGQGPIPERVSAPIILSVQVRSAGGKCTLGRCTLVQWAKSLERVTWNRGKTPASEKNDELPCEIVGTT